MDATTKQLCEQLTAIIDEYADCGSCGKVIKDQSLLVPDPFNPGRFRSTCPSCRKEATMVPFPPKELKPVFEMITESAERNRPILVLVLSCTVYEALVEGLFFRILERHFTYPEISDAVIDATEYHSKMRIIRNITGKKPKDLAKSVGYDNLMSTLEDIKSKRNGFLHTGVAMKFQTEELKIGNEKFSFPKRKDLDDEDIQQALRFTIDTVNCFAKLYSDYGEYVYIDERDY